MKTREEELNEFINNDNTIIKGDIPPNDPNTSVVGTTDTADAAIRQPISPSSPLWGLGYTLMENNNKENVIEEDFITKKRNEKPIHKLDDEFLAGEKVIKPFENLGRNSAMTTFGFVKNFNNSSPDDKVSMLSFILDRIKLDEVDYGFKKLLMDKFSEMV